jgi:hypothetical protein
MPISVADFSRPEPDQFLDGDMTALENLSFRHAHSWQRAAPYRLVSLDQAARDYIVVALLQRVHGGLV